MLDKIEEFYSENFHLQKYWKSTDSKADSVWNLHWDDKHNLVYIVLATIKESEGGR